MRKGMSKTLGYDEDRVLCHGSFLETEAQFLLQHEQLTADGAGRQMQITPKMVEYLTRGVHDGFTGVSMDNQVDDFVTNRYIRNFSTLTPIPFSAFDGIRRSKHKVELTPVQEESVMRSFDKLVKQEEASRPGSSSKLTKEMSTPLPFVSVFFDQHCRAETTGGVTTLPNSRSGATYLLLAVITGHYALGTRCLKAGANPNNMSFLRDPSTLRGEMQHGFSPMFMAVLAEQIGMMDLLYSYGGSIHIYDRWGRTPLHAAVAMDSVEVVQWLISRGAPRYVGDCLNVTPAESPDGYFPELAMPNPALRSCRPKPPLHYLRSQVDGTAATPPTNNTSTSTESVQLCHCHSGRPAGFCGCVDDMYVRWAVDRLSTVWCPGTDFFALAQQQSSDDLQRIASVAARRRK